MDFVSDVGDLVVVARGKPLLVATRRKMDLLGCLSGSIALGEDSPVQIQRN